MEQLKQAEEIVLILTRRYPFPRERVFRAWTEEEALRQWFITEDHALSEVELDAREGGRYRFGMQSKEGEEVLYVGGQFIELQAPERMAFTWRWEGVPKDSPEMLVTVDLIAHGEETELVLKHTRFPSVDVRDAHQEGWNPILDNLGKHLTQ